MHSRALRTLAPVSLAALSTLVACAAAEGNDQLAGGAGEGTGGTENGGQGGSTSTGGVSGTTPMGGTGNPTGGTGNPTGGATATGGTGNPTGGTGNPTGGTTSTGGTGMMPPGRQTIPLPYTDDFETSEARDWRFISVPWTVVADDTNVLQLSGTGDSETTWAVGGDRNWTDVRVSMKVKFVSGDAMILLSPRWANLDSYAFVEYEAEDKPKLRSRVNGSTSDLITAAETITFATGMWHTVVVTIVGTTTTLEIDGTMIGMNASSTLAPSGGIGIAVENGIVAIDDVSVTAP